MSLRTFWKLFFQIIGIVIFLHGIEQIIENLGMVVPYFFELGVGGLLFFVICVAFYVLDLYLLVFNPEIAIRFFKLERHISSEQIQFDKSYDSLIRLGIIVIGGLMIINNVPELIHIFSVYFIFSDIGPFDSFEFKKAEMIMYIVKIGIGLVMLNYSQALSNLIKRKAEENKDVLDDQQPERDI